MPSYEGSYEAYASAGAEPAGAEPAGGTTGEPAGSPPGGFAGRSAGGSSWPAPSFSHRAALLILLLAAVILLRVVAAGKLTRAWKALTQASPSSSSSGSVAAGGGGSTVSGTTSSGQLNPRVFGVSSAPLTGFGESSPTVAAADQAGLTFFGGGRLAHDYNFGAQAGTPIRLPLGERWKVLGDQYKPASQGGWGHLFGFEAIDPSGRALPGVLELPHIDPVAGLGAGEILPGGTTVGAVGTLSQPTPYWTGPHLAVIVDEKMNSLLKSLGA